MGEQFALSSHAQSHHGKLERPLLLRVRRSALMKMPFLGRCLARLEQVKAIVALNRKHVPTATVVGRNLRKNWVLRKPKKRLSRARNVRHVVIATWATLSVVLPVRIVANQHSSLERKSSSHQWKQKPQASWTCRWIVMRLESPLMETSA